MLSGFRKRAASESGFTLMELLVVMLILGILASIAMVAYFNQRGKANDSQAKSIARTLMTAMETCATEEGGSYSSCDIAALRAIEAVIPQTGSTVTASSTADTYSVSAESKSGNTFEIERDSDGSVDRPCTVPSGNNRGGCPPGDIW